MAAEHRGKTGRFSTSKRENRKDHVISSNEGRKKILGDHMYNESFSHRHVECETIELGSEETVVTNANDRWRDGRPDCKSTCTHGWTQHMPIPELFSPLHLKNIVTETKQGL